MMLEVSIDNDGEWDSRTPWEALGRRAAEAAIAESAFPQLIAASRSVELAIRLSDNDAVRALNAEWRGKDKPTNVLSFPLVEEEDLLNTNVDGPEMLLGDIVLARDVCSVEAAEKGVSVPDHAAHLIVHGTLHLLGYDHHDEAAAEDMEARESRALARLGIADPYGDRD